MCCLFLISLCSMALNGTQELKEVTSKIIRRRLLDMKPNHANDEKMVACNKRQVLILGHSELEYENFAKRMIAESETCISDAIEEEQVRPFDFQLTYEKSRDCILPISSADQKQEAGSSKSAARNLTNFEIQYCSDRKNSLKLPLLKRSCSYIPSTFTRFHVIVV